MFKKNILFFCAIGLFWGTALSAHASLTICQKGKCEETSKGASIRPWLRQLYTFFKTPNVRIDFCEADYKTHLCLQPDLKWSAKSPLIDVSFTIPVARTIPHKNTLLIDYMVTANETLPSCSFSNSTFEITKDNIIRLVSHAFDCQLTDIGTTQLQNTFFVDYIDFDRSIVGAQYTIQTHGDIHGIASGYTLMKFRDGNSLIPIVAQHEHGDMPKAPDEYMAMDLYKQQLSPVSVQKTEGGFAEGLNTWWDKLKESFNLDKQKQKSTSSEEPHWWNEFTDTFMKVIYLEPLD